MESLFIAEQCYDPKGLYNQFWDTMLTEDLNYWWPCGVEGADYLKFYCCL